jgi:hypothetical protein
MLIEELIQTIRSGGTEAHEAALALGLLIEREKVNRPNPEDDGGIREIIGDELANRRLSQMELNTAVNELIRYIDETIKPHSMAVWALTKSYEPRILPHLLALLDKVVNDTTQENLTYQTLVGIINIGIPSSYKDLSLAAIRKAAEHGHGEVMETATQYLENV